MLVKLQSYDKKIYEVDERIARMSKLLSTKLDDPECNAETKPIYLDDKHLSGRILEQILKWCNYHLDNPEDIYGDSDSEEEDDKSRYGMKFIGHRFRWCRRFVWITEWDKTFLREMDNSTLFTMINAVHYLKIKLLLNMACKTVAMMIRGKSPEEIRQLFSIVNDLEPEELKSGDDEILLVDSTSRR